MRNSSGQFLALKTRLFWPKATFLFLNVPRRGGRRGSNGLVIVESVQFVKSDHEMFVIHERIVNPLACDIVDIRVTLIVGLPPRLTSF